MSKRLTASSRTTSAGCPSPSALSWRWIQARAARPSRDPRHRIARLPGRPLDRDDRLGAADHALPCRPGRDGRAGPSPPMSRMGEGGRLAGGEQAVDRAARRLAPVGVELAEQLHQADPLAGSSPRPAWRASAGLSSIDCEPGFHRHEALPGLPSALPARPAERPPAADPLRVAVRILKRLEELRVAERADQEMGGPVRIERVERLEIAAREQHQKRRAIGLGGIGEASHRLFSFRKGAARVDHRDRRSRRDEPALGIVRAPSGDGEPSGPLGGGGKLVAMPEGQQEKRCAGRGHASLSLPLGRRFEPHRSTLGLSPQQSV